MLKREEDFNKQIQQLHKDKQRLDELMSLKDKDIAHYKEEISSLKSKLEWFLIFINRRLWEQHREGEEGEYKTSREQI